MGVYKNKVMSSLPNKKKEPASTSSTFKDKVKAAVPRKQDKSSSGSSKSFQQKMDEIRGSDDYKNNKDKVFGILPRKSEDSATSDGKRRKSLSQHMKGMYYG
ncbi:hypothetical protein BT69DRAFT_1285448 [Atractiella rhizophila]|nr:hypothetical protein BT69DRAFT_1285448 [Atractiella rhizophila]